MTEQVEGEDTPVILKYRLVGAAVLLTLAVVVLPLIFSSTDNDSVSEGEILPQSGGNAEEFQSRIIPIEVETPDQQPNTVEQRDENNIVVAKGDPDAVTKPEPDIQTSGENSTASPDPDPTVSGEGSGQGWIVRIGTFKEVKNAENIKGLLSEKGFKPQSGEVDTGVGKAVRVWVGPYSKKVTASRILSRIEDEIGEKGFISAYP